MQNQSKKFLNKLDSFKNTLTIGQLLYAAEQTLEHATLIGWENDSRREKYNALSNQIKQLRIQRKEDFEKTNL